MFESKSKKRNVNIKGDRKPSYLRMPRVASENIVGKEEPMEVDEAHHIRSTIFEGGDAGIREKAAVTYRNPSVILNEEPMEID